MAKVIIGVMGPGSGASALDIKIAYEIGRLIAKENWVLLTGGRNQGVMDSANKGAKSVGGLTVGILPTAERKTFSKYVDVLIVTEMKSARNNINVLSSQVVVVCGMGAGTASEAAMAIKANKKVVLINQDKNSCEFFEKVGGGQVVVVNTPVEVIKKIKLLI